MADYRKQDTIAFTTGDVTGDGNVDQIYLTGKKVPNGELFEQITLVIRDGRTGVFKNIKLKQNVGYQPTLFLCDFNGDGVLDIMIRIDSGGSGAITYSYIYSYAKSDQELLFDSEYYNEQYQYTVRYMDNYFVKITSKENDTEYLVDLSNREDEYLDEIYTEDGELKRPITGEVDPISLILPGDIKNDGGCQLLLFQEVWGLYHADALGYIENFLCWDKYKQKFVLMNQYLGITGTETKKRSD